MNKRWPDPRQSFQDSSDNLMRQFSEFSLCLSRHVSGLLSEFSRGQLLSCPQVRVQMFRDSPSSAFTTRTTTQPKIGTEIYRHFRIETMMTLRAATKIRKKPFNL